MLSHLFGIFDNLFLSYTALCMLQFNPEAGLFHLISREPLSVGEKRWLAANLVDLLGQLFLLTCMWVFFRNRISKTANEVRFVDTLELLSKCGLIRGSHSLCTHLLKCKRSFAYFGISLATALWVVLLQWSEVQVLRFITVLHVLIYFDAWSCLYSQTGQSTPVLLPSILREVRSTPHAGVATVLHLAMHLPLAFTRFAYILILSPTLSFGLLMRYFLIPYTRRYMAKPISPPPSSTPPDKRFCKVCDQTLLEALKSGRDLKLGESYPHQPTISSLRKSALEGCRVCVAVYERMCTVPSDWAASVLFFRDHATYWQSFGNGWIIMQSQWKDSLCQFGTIDITADFEPCVAEDLEDHTGSSNSLKTAEEWFSKCLLNHPACRDGRDLDFRPSRLLYLGDSQRIRLHTIKDYPKTLGYMTLSHCWGGAQFIQLRKNNEEEFKDDIPWEELPQTFQDAIQVARHLGSKYLWIDSLCILQDSTQDWMTESKMMGNVYKNAICNIAASDATNSREGCLYARNRRTITPERLPWSSAKSPKGQYLVNMTGIMERRDRLYSRAWVLQELLLARRTLDCARDQIYWRCDQLVASEELPRGVSAFNAVMCHPSLSIMGTTNEISSLRAMVMKMQDWESSNRKVLQDTGPRGQSEAFLRAHYGRQCPVGYWSSIVEIYSRMSITHDADRPIALSGVIDSFRPFLGEYLAGMWQDLLPGHLAWSIQTFSDLHSQTRSRCRRPSTKRAPSWSWLSLEGPIHYKEMSEYHGSFEDKNGENPGARVLARLLDVEVLSSHDIHLRLSAPMICATWVGVQTDFLTSSLGASGFKPVAQDAPQGLTIVDMDRVAKWRVSPDVQSCIDSHSTIIIVFDVAEEEQMVRDVYLVAIRTRFSMIEGLVLQKRKDGVFTRVGRFTAWDSAVQALHEGNRVEFTLA